MCCHCRSVRTRAVCIVWLCLSVWKTTSFLLQRPLSSVSSRTIPRNLDSSFPSNNGRSFGASREYFVTLLRASGSSDDDDATRSSSTAVAATNDNTAIPATTTPTDLDDTQTDFMIGYLNRHHADFLTAVAVACSSVGADMAAANVWSGKSYAVETAVASNLDRHQLTLRVTIQRRNQPVEERTVEVVFAEASLVVSGRSQKAAELPSVPLANSEGSVVPRLPVDEVVRQLCRLCAMVKHPEVSGKLIQLAFQLGGAGVGELPENMYLNQVPHNRYVRQWFYDKASTAIHDAVVLASRGKITSRQQIITMFPETNPQMDTYRIGTILELVRTAAIRLAEENVRVKVCVQGSMGVGIFTGVPKQLNGVAKLLQMMDWQSEIGEENEGMVGDYVRFGAVGASHVVNEERDDDGVVTQHQDDVFIIIAPQSMVGSDSSIYPLLRDMVLAAGDRPVILVNADLTDKVSAAGQQNVRGRQERMDFADSFETIYHFQNVYVSGTSYYPILGAVVKLHPEEPWVAHQRRDFANDGGEIYVPVLAGETMPTGESILGSFEK